MEEVFQNFEHYQQWILANWAKDKILDEVIKEQGLMIPKETSPESFTQITKEEFNKRDSENFIKIPTVYDSQDYQDGHRLAEDEINQFDEW